MDHGNEGMRLMTQRANGDGFVISQAQAIEKDVIRNFTNRIVYQSDKDNPFVVSMREDDFFIDEAFAVDPRYVFFLVRQADRVVARCAVGMRLDSEDICAYGDACAQLYHEKKMASLIGDLVDPSFRGCGLQGKMIAYRIDWLKRKGVQYAVAGILKGNEASARNYLAAGFVAIGSKTITWKSQPGRCDFVTLYGLDLQGL